LVFFVLDSNSFLLQPETDQESKNVIAPHAGRSFVAAEGGYGYLEQEPLVL
jgi:hypothetical protein